MKRTALASILSVVVALAIAGCSSSSSGLTGKAWQWISGTEAGTPMPGVVPNPENYTATFNTDGTISVKADCNNSQGAYKTSNSSLTITLGATTQAMCPPGSLSTLFLAALPKASTYAISSNSLLITLSDGGTMTFN